jgi:hypothetical protein
MRISGHSEKEVRFSTGQDRRLRLNFEFLSCGGSGGSSGSYDDDDDDMVLGLR